MHSVQKNVPMPRFKGTVARRKYPFEQLEVGDMFFVPAKRTNTLATQASTAGKALERKFTTRLMHMRETLEGWEPCDPDHPSAVVGVGVWRTA